MTLATRIIPVLLHRNGSLIKGKQFDSWRSVGFPLQAARIHAARGVDELMLLDLGADKPDCKMVEKLTRNSFTPVTVGGGVNSISDVSDLLNAGADKICIKSKSVIQDASKMLGRQAICASLEVRDDDYIDQAKELEDLGAGEILLQSVDRDGMMEGYDLEVITRVTRNISIPVIASCGCGTPQHMLEAIQAGASAVAAGAMFQFSSETPKSAAEYLSQHGIEARK